MKTLEKHVTIIDNTGFDKPISVNSICDEFFGIIKIQYIFNVYSKMVGVYISTINKGTVDVVVLGMIQKRLNAISLSIRLEVDGLGYILHYDVK